MGGNAGRSGATCSSNECGLYGLLGDDPVKEKKEKENRRERESCSVCM